MQGCKLTLARTPEAGKFHRGRVGRLEIHARPASREYTQKKNYFPTMYTEATVVYT